MKKAVYFIIIALFAGLNSMAQAKKITSKASSLNLGHAVQISLKPYQNTKIYIGTNYGKNRVLADSCILNERSEGVFTSTKKLSPGVYFVISPKYTILFDFLIDEEQHFKIIADTTALTDFKIIGSNDNTIFKEYTKSINILGSELNTIESSIKIAMTATDTATLRAQYIAKDKQIKEKRSYFTTTYPKSMTSYLLNVMQRPEAPSVKLINGKPDSTYPYYYVKNHFWDKVIFNDNRLIRTPFFEDKLDEYFKNYVSRDPDSIIDEVQYLLTVAKTGKEIYPFLLFKFTNKYISPEFMGQDKVFLHIYQNFFAKGDTVLLSAESKKSITERAYSIMANQLGLPAPILVLNDLQDKHFALHNIKAPYTFIAFWDPSCSHCKVEIPRLDSMYKANWKALNVAVLSVNINPKEITAWKKFITDHQLEGWINGYQTEADLNSEIKAGKPSTIRQLYDVFKTPTFYLLDKDKKIIAKNLSLDQFNDFLLSPVKKNN